MWQRMWRKQKSIRRKQLKRSENNENSGHENIKAKIIRRGKLGINGEKRVNKGEENRLRRRRKYGVTEAKCRKMAAEMTKAAGGKQ